MNTYSLKDLCGQIRQAIQKQLYQFIHNSNQRQRVSKIVSQHIQITIFEKIVQQINALKYWVNNLGEENQYLRSCLQMMQLTIQDLKTKDNKYVNNFCQEQGIISKFHQIKDSISIIKEQLIQSEGSIEHFEDRLIQIQEKCLKFQSNLYLFQQQREKSLFQNQKQGPQNRKKGETYRNLNDKHKLNFIKLRQSVRKLQNLKIEYSQNIQQMISQCKKELLCQAMTIYINKISKSINSELPLQLQRIKDKKINNKISIKKNIQKLTVGQINKKFKILQEQNKSYQEKIDHILNS